MIEANDTSYNVSLMMNTEIIMYSRLTYTPVNGTSYSAVVLQYIENYSTVIIITMMKVYYDVHISTTVLLSTVVLYFK